MIFNVICIHFYHQGVWREHETGRCWDRNKVERKIFYKPNGEEIYVDMLKRTQIFMKGIYKNKT